MSAIEQFRTNSEEFTFERVDLPLLQSANMFVGLDKEILNSTGATFGYMGGDEISSIGDILTVKYVAMWDVDRLISFVECLGGTLMDIRSMVSNSVGHSPNKAVDICVVFVFENAATMLDLFDNAITQFVSQTKTPRLTKRLSAHQANVAVASIMKYKLMGVSRVYEMGRADVCTLQDIANVNKRCTPQGDEYILQFVAGPYMDSPFQITRKFLNVDESYALGLTLRLPSPKAKAKRDHRKLQSDIKRAVNKLKGRMRKELERYYHTWSLVRYNLTPEEHEVFIVGMAFHHSKTTKGKFTKWAIQYSMNQDYSEPAATQAAHAIWNDRQMYLDAYQTRMAKREMFVGADL